MYKFNMAKSTHYFSILLFCLFFSTQASAFDYEIKLEDLFTLLEHPLLLLVVGFLLTGFFGQILIGKIQRRNWKHQFEIERLNRQIKETRTVYEHISLLLDKRIYRSRRLYYSFNDRDIREINNKCVDCFKEFNEMLYKWNDSLNNNIAKIESYFGEKNGKFFQDRLCADLRWVGILLRRYYYNMKDKPSLKNINKAIEITNERVYEMNKRMFVKIRELENKLEVHKK